MSRELAVLLVKIILLFIVIEVLIVYGLLWLALGSYFLAFITLLFKPELMDFKLLWGMIFTILLLIKLTGGN